MFASRNRSMPERNRVQALFPAGTEPIPNALGTAPGVWMRVGDCLLVAMPGVPSEMYGMYASQVKPHLLSLGLAGGVLLQRKLNCFGAGESAVEEQLLDLARAGTCPRLASPYPMAPSPSESSPVPPARQMPRRTSHPWSKPSGSG